MGYDIYTEIRKLGKHICEFHAKKTARCWVREKWISTKGARGVR